MIVYRALVAGVSIVTALLLQATLVGRLAVAVPVSCALVVVLSVAALAGPGTGIALGFGAGLLADLASGTASQHLVGTLALTWMIGGLVAGRAGGMVASGAAGIGERLVGARRWPRRTDPRPLASGRRNRRRAALQLRQAVLVGALGGGVALATTVLDRILGVPVGALPAALERCLPAAAGDAVVALVVLPVASRVLDSAALRGRTAVRPSAPAAPTMSLTAS